MSFGDPTYADDCTCRARALKREEAVLYAVPKKNGMVETIVFAKDCPKHGYFRISACDSPKTD